MRANWCWCIKFLNVDFPWKFCFVMNMLMMLNLVDVVFMLLFMSMDYNMVNKLLVVDVLYLYTLILMWLVMNACIYIVVDIVVDYSRWIVVNICMVDWVICSCIICRVRCLYPYCRWPDTCIHIAVDYSRWLWCFCCIMRWRPWWQLVPHAHMSRV